MKTLLISTAASLALLLCGPAWANPEKICGKLAWNYGPFDYRIASAHSRALVEDAHFTEGVESLTKEKTGSFGGDIGYTLSVFPNHARALLAMERLAEIEKRDRPNGAGYTVECWYERALRFIPSDHVPRLLFANFLIRKQRPAEALKQLDYVAETTQDIPLAQLNVGMLYFDMKLYDKALRQAHRVMAMGIDRRELRERLASVGQWQDPPADGAAAPAAAASAASAP